MKKRITNQSSGRGTASDFRRSGQGMNIQYKIGEQITPEQFADILKRSGLAERRPADDPECLAGMIMNSNLVVTAWSDERLVGIARSVTDFHYCCYLSDIAVDRDFQKSGIGRKLIEHTQSRLGKKCKIILLSAPAAVDYYPHIGFERHDEAWVLSAGKEPRKERR